MDERDTVPGLVGRAVRDNAGDRIGRVGDVYLDSRSGRAEWVSVRTGRAGTTDTFVPLVAARMEGEELVLDLPKDRVANAPKIGGGGLSDTEEAALYRYYGIDRGSDPEWVAAGTADTDRTDGPLERAPVTDDASPDKSISIGEDKYGVGGRLRRRTEAHADGGSPGPGDPELDL
jgi:sporulation protein YlmC with PRC-barrel domain